MIFSMFLSLSMWVEQLQLFKKRDLAPPFLRKYNTKNTFLQANMEHDYDPKSKT